ncbi:MAG: LacI family DNA-binding transcriptional regulator [Opitutaceae bacterium]|nr:LacI family DNA-binding transcriptional regulator [Opitutaceae bacterium]
MTLRDIAKAAGVHFSTVSLAMRDHPRLSRATCKKVQSTARELGYVPDPMLASLANYRLSLRPVEYRATLAWVTAFPERDQWRRNTIFREQYEGARARAEALGYKLEEFWLCQPGMTARRASHILRTRNITGLIIAPLPMAGGVLRLDWPQFSAVAIGYSLSSPPLHLVCAHQFRCIRLALHELAMRGYRRVGLVMLKSSDDRVDNNWLAGYLVEQYAEGGREHLRPLLLDAWDETSFEAWLLRERPDAVVSKVPQTLSALRARGIAVPQDMGVAYLSPMNPGDEHSGVNENSESVGAAAVDFVAGMLHRNERGVPALPHRLLIDGVWIEGRTTRARLVEATS